MKKMLFIGVLVVVALMIAACSPDPNNYLPDRCQFGNQMQCLDSTLEDGAVNDKAVFKLENALPQDMHVADISYKLAEKTEFVPCVEGSSAMAVLPSEESGMLTCLMAPDTLTSNEKAKVQFKIKYSKGGVAYEPNYPQNLIGEIYSRVN